MNFKQKYRGFTLIELLVVVSIIAMLTSVILAAIYGARDKARLSKAYQAMTSLNQTIFSCFTSGLTLQTVISGMNPNVAICSGRPDLYPNLTDTGFQYCGVSCGGTVMTSTGYAISVYSDSYGGWTQRKVIICGTNHDTSLWFGGTPGMPLSISSDIKCLKNF